MRDFETLLDRLRKRLSGLTGGPRFPEMVALGLAASAWSVLAGRQ